MFGFHGRYWRYDLTTERASWVDLPERVLRAYLGGVGLGTWILHRESSSGFDPLAPEAPIIFSFSPLVGTPFTTSAKFAVLAKSPLTGLLCDALSSSHFAIAGKRMGADAIVLVGRCAQPSVLVGDRLHPTDLWGASAAEVGAALARQGSVTAIGPAGENGVRFATLSNDGRHAGRGGLGAIFGAKRLKAFVVRGDHDTTTADPGRVRSLARSLAKRSLGEGTAKYRELGTAANVLAFERVGALPGPNFRSPPVRDLSGLDPGSLEQDHSHVRASCASCTIGCEHRYGGARGEYESLFALGPLCGIHDSGVVLEAIGACDRLGLDTISAGGSIAFAMECRERGLVASGPRFGDGAGMIALLRDMAYRQGDGAWLSDGSRRAALRLGRGSLAFAPQIKGLELPGYEPRALQTMALGLAVATRGADHNRSAAYELDFSSEVDRLHGDAHSAARALEPEDRAAVLDSMVLCKFLRGAMGDFYAESAEILSAVTGFDFDAAELRAAARRIVDCKKRFNVREGWQPSDDTLPARFFDEALESGPVQGAAIGRAQLGEMIRSYNLARGWSPEGYPPTAVPEDFLVDG